MIYSKQGGAKVLGHKIANKDGHTAIGAWAKVGGVKKRVLTPIPSNMIVLYSLLADVPGTADIMDGTEGTEDLIGWHAMIESVTPGSIFDTLGSWTHNASEHGSAVQGVAANSNSKDIEHHNTLTNGYLLHLSTHDHNVTQAHTHSGVKSLEGQSTKQSLIPAIGGPVAAAGSIWLVDNEPDAIYDLLFELWGDLVSTCQLWFDDADSTYHYATPSHDHLNSAAFSTASTTQTRYDDSRRRGRAMYYRHGHYVSSAGLPSKDHSQLHLKVGAYEAQVDITFIDILPSGTLGLFTTDTIPDGWTDLATFDDHGIMLCDPASSTLGIAGGAATHAHGSTSGLGNSGDHSILSEDSDAGAEYWRQSLANHTGSAHTHSGSAANAPPSKKIWVATKD